MSDLKMTATDVETYLKDHFTDVELIGFLRSPLRHPDDFEKSTILYVVRGMRSKEFIVHSCYLDPKNGFIREAGNYYSTTLHDPPVHDAGKMAFEKFQERCRW